MAAQLDIGDLVERSKSGTVTDAEIDSAAALLASGHKSLDLYGLLYVIARTNARRHEGLVARCLENRDEPMVARLALQTLCTFWGVTSQYLDDLRRFLVGVEWDAFGDLRQVAITAAGEYLAEGKDCSLLSELLNLSRPENDEALERRIATEALARAIGQPLRETIDSNKGATSWDAWALDVRKRGALRIASECNSSMPTRTA